VFSREIGERGRDRERKREPWVNDQACLTAVVLAGRSGTDDIDFQLTAVLTIARACNRVRLDIT
jgi:hypothetical protein